MPWANQMFLSQTLAVDRSETSQLCAAHSAESEQMSSLLQDNQSLFVNKMGLMFECSYALISGTWMCVICGYEGVGVGIRLKASGDGPSSLSVLNHYAHAWWTNRSGVGMHLGE